MGLKCLSDQTWTIKELLSFLPATLSDAALLMPAEPGTSISHGPRSQEREQSLNEDRSSTDGKMPFLRALQEGKKRQLGCKKCWKRNSDKCKLFKVIFGTVAQGLSQYKLLRLFAISKE